MPHELSFDEKGAKMFYVKEDGAPWHGLGTAVDKALTAKEALETARLNWEVELWSLEAVHEDDHVAITDKRAVVRADSHAPLGVVGVGYRPIQNWQLFDFMDTLIGSRQAIYRTAGELRGGKIIWLMAQRPEPIEPVKDDPHVPYILATSSHDGTKSCIVANTLIRVVCMNTVNLALEQAVQSVRIVHTGDIYTKINQARKVLQLSDVYNQRYNELASVLSSRDLTTQGAKAVLDELFPEADSKRGQTIRQNAQSSILQLFDGGGRGLDKPGVRGTAYGLWNAIIEWCDHERRTRKSRYASKEENRVHSIWFGSAKQFKQRALEVLAV